MMEKFMENRNLYTFQRVCELSSITKAAEQLGYAQSTVTTQIKLLESELGVKLFERYGNTLRITAPGEKLLAYSNEIFKITEKFMGTLHTGEAITGTLQIAAADSLCMTVLPAILQKFMANYPAVKVRILSAGAEDAKQLLASGQADIALVLDFAKPPPELLLLKQQPVAIHFYTAASTASAPAEIQLEDLAHKRFAVTEPACRYRKQLDAFWAENGIEPVILLESTSTEALIKIAASGLAITYLPAIVARQTAQLQQLQIKNIAPPAPLLLQLLLFKNKWQSPLLNKFIEIATAEFTDNT